jgi:hypothetical protein
LFNGRLIAFVYPGDHPQPDGSAVFVDEALVDSSVNAALPRGGARLSRVLRNPAGHSAHPRRRLTTRARAVLHPLQRLERGGAVEPYDPEMMLALILYCNGKRMVTARPIAAACVDDLDAMMITAGCARTGPRSPGSSAGMRGDLRADAEDGASRNQTHRADQLFDWAPWRGDARRLPARGVGRQGVLLSASVAWAVRRLF